MVMNLVSGLDITLFSMILMSRSSAVGLPTSPEYIILFPLTVRWVLLDYFLSGQTLH